MAGVLSGYDMECVCVNNMLCIGNEWNSNYGAVNMFTVNMCFCLPQIVFRKSENVTRMGLHSKLNFLNYFQVSVHLRTISLKPIIAPQVNCVITIMRT